MSITDFKFELPKPTKPVKAQRQKTRKTKPQYTYPRPEEVPPGWEVWWGGTGVGFIVGLR